MTTIVLRDDFSVEEGKLAALQVSPRSTLYRCAKCDTDIYVASTTYPVTYILRTGTLDDSEIKTPQAHIWIKRKMPWVILPENVPSFPEDYDRDSTWPDESLQRIRLAENILKNAHS